MKDFRTYVAEAKKVNEYKDGFHIFYPYIPLKFNYRYYV